MIANDNIVSLYQSKDDMIWIGTSIGLSSYDPETETFANYFPPDIKGWIHDIKEDENGLLWLATINGLFSFDRSTNLTRHYKTDDAGLENIQGILIDFDTLWLSSETGIIKFNKKNKTVKKFRFPHPAYSDFSKDITHNIIKDSKGFLWMSTYEDGLYRLNPETGKLKRYVINIPDTVSSNSRIITHIFEDADGKIWIGGEGVAILDPVSEKITYHQIMPKGKEGIPGKIHDMLKDRYGIYWLATEGGISKYDPKLYSFTTIKAKSPYTLEGANTILEDKDHEFWVGKYTGIGSLNTDNSIYKNYSEVLGIKNEQVNSSLLDIKDGSFWFGSSGCLLHVYKDKQIGLRLDRKIIIPEIKGAQITVLAFGTNGIIWAGTNGGGLLRFDPKTSTRKAFPGFASKENPVSFNTIKSLLFISPDSLLIGTEGNGILLMHTKEEIVERIKFEKDKNNSEFEKLYVNAIYLDYQKNIWIGTMYDGLWQTNTSFSKIRNYSDSVKDGITNSTIKQIAGDEQGHLWINTNSGIDVIDLPKKRVVHFSENDGLNISQSQSDYLLKKASGEFIRVDINGLHVFDSTSINLNKEAPPVYVNRFTVLNKIIPVYRDTVINLKYFENDITFDYVALNYTQPFKNRYKYMLQVDGLDNNWIDEDNDDRKIAYPNLSPGEYVFRVTACNNEGIWNEKGARIFFNIAPPFWNTWLFYILCVLLIAGAVYFLFKYRLRQRLKTLEIRNSISRDLHDEVGSTLSSIGFLSSMALNEVDNNNGKLRNSLLSISESAHMMLDAMNDIIWNIQPKNDILENIIARMMSFASELLEARNISLKCHIAEHIKHLHLGLAVRHDFYVIFKESVNNLAKYSCASEAFISIEFSQPYIILIISDNGIGFDPNIIKEGNGLRNMQNRANKIGAKYCLHSEPGKGTTMILKIRPT